MYFYLTIAGEVDGFDMGAQTYVTLEFAPAAA